MLKISDVTDTAVNDLFVNADAPNQVDGTFLMAEWLNAVQQEIISVLTQAGISTNPAQSNQLSQAITTILGGYVPTTRTVNGKALSGNIITDSQDIFNTYAIAIPGAQNINDYKTPGVYYQPIRTQAESGSNYPEATAGTLIVLRNAAPGATQLWVTYNSSKMWIRSYYGSAGTFTAWTMFYNSQNSPTTGNIAPATTATYNLGTASLTYNNIYSQNAVTVVSDRNLKTEIGEIPDNVLDAWSTINYSQWRLKSAIEEKGEAARLHVGIVAQEIKEAFEAAGLDATDYGILIHDVWEASEATEYVPSVTDEETGEVLKPAVEAQPAKEAGEIWMVRMEECLAMESALLRRTQKRFEERLAALENA